MRGNIWTLVAALFVMLGMVLMFISSTISVKTQQLATQNKIEELRINSEMKANREKWEVKNEVKE